MIAEAKEIRENQSYRHAAAISQANKQLQNNNNNNNSQDADSDEEDVNSRTMKQFPEDCGTLVPGRDDGDGTMIAHTDCGTLVPDSATMVELQSNLGTMVINSDSEESTMKSKSLFCSDFEGESATYLFLGHDTNPDKPKYRPLFLDHFDKKEAEAASFVTKANNQHNYNDEESSSPEDPHQDASPQRPQPQVQTPTKQQVQQVPDPSAPPLTQSLEEQQLNEERQRFQSHLQLQLNQISAANGPNMQHQIQYQQSPVAVTTPDGLGGGGGGGNGAMEAHNRNFNNRINLIDSEYDSVRNLTSVISTFLKLQPIPPFFS